jgi:hypothetical protein
MKKALLHAIVVAVCVAAPLAVPTFAQATVPSAQIRADAKRFARDYWEERGRYAPCYGVRIRMAHAGPNSLGFVRRRSRPCTIFLNRDNDWGNGGTQRMWWSVCATVIHEWGHLVGRGHTRNPESIMAVTESLNRVSSWWPYFPACRYEGDDADDDGLPDW